MNYLNFGDDEIKAEMNFIPLIDVILVLMIVFMAVAPTVNSNIYVDVPKVAVDDSAINSNVTPDTLIISINEKKMLFVSSPYLGIMDNEKSIESIPSFISALLRERPETKVFLRSDGNLAYSEVANIMNTIKLSGASRINLVTEGVEFNDG